jgi:hypothetical protein
MIYIVPMETYHTVGTTMIYIVPIETCHTVGTTMIYIDPIETGAVYNSGTLEFTHVCKWR